MTITEAQRFEMQVELRKVLGENVSNSLMEHLPPVGWADVARRSDIDHLEQRIAKLENSMKAIVAVGTTCFLGLLAMQFQIMLSIAHLK